MPAATTADVEIVDTEPGVQRTLVKISLAGGPFLNGIDETGSDKEIEFLIEGGNEADDDLLLEPGPGATDDNWRMGNFSDSKGINLNDAETGTEDVNDVRAFNMEWLQIIADNDGDDILDARGGTGFIGPMTMPGTVKQLVGGDGDDQIYAGEGDDWSLEGDLGADSMIGGGGNDSIRASFGTDPDVMDGNGGTDFCSFQNHNAPVRVDLGVTGPQDTLGAGMDTFSDCEGLLGGNGGDTLIGDAGPNTIFGLEGDDVLRPGASAADDTVDGGAGTGDTVSYSNVAPSGATVSLATAGPQSTGYGMDAIANTENLVGTPFADTLTGDAGINRIEGGDGVDTISLGANDDVFDSYDALADTVDCGDGNDSGFASEAGVDTLTNCESSDFAPDTSVVGGPPEAALTNDATPSYPLTASEGGVTFAVQVDGGAYTACGSTCTVPALADGTHTLRFRAIESAGAQHADPTPAERTITVETQAPGVSINSGPSGKTTDTSPSFTFSSGDAGAELECRVDGAPFGPCSGTGSHTAPGLGFGPHSFAVRATDLAGNTSTASRGFTVVRPPDTVAPNTIVKKPRVKGDAAKVKFSSTEPGSTFTCKLDRKKARTCKSPKRYRKLDNGRHKVVVTAIDAAGNADPTPGRVKFRIR